jgi:hypothetical protein
LPNSPLHLTPPIIRFPPLTQLPPLQSQIEINSLKLFPSPFFPFYFFFFKKFAINPFTLSSDLLFQNFILISFTAIPFFMRSEHSIREPFHLDNHPDSSSENQWTCAICFGPLQEPVVTPCGHIFCGQCIGQWLRRSDKCPTCIGHIESKHLIRVNDQKQFPNWSSYPSIPFSQIIKVVYLLIILIVMMTL